MKTKTEFRARPGNQFGKGAHKKAEIYGRELQRIAQSCGGQVTPDDIVKNAECAESPLHDFIYQHDDKIAAYNYRLQLARHLVMHIELVEIFRNEIVSHCRIMHNVTTERGRAYVPVTEIRMRGDYQDELAERCKEDFLIWADQYDEIIDLFKIRTKIEQFKTELSTAVKDFTRKRKI